MARGEPPAGRPSCLAQAPARAAILEGALERFTAERVPGDRFEGAVVVVGRLRCTPRKGSAVVVPFLAPRFLLPTMRHL